MNERKQVSAEIVVVGVAALVTELWSASTWPSAVARRHIKVAVQEATVNKEFKNSRG